MKIKFLILLLLLSFFAYSQNTIRVYYKAESIFKTDLQGNPEKDLFILEINTKTQKSKFYNAAYKALDSVYTKLVEFSKRNGAVNFDTRNMKYPNLNLGVVDNGNAYELYRVFNGDVYKYTEPKQLKWDIENETKEIEGYKSKKAVTTVNGRTWEVYFSEELPLPFGPYVLGQLPGVVLDAKDSTGTFSFIMIGIEKNVSDSDFLPSVYQRAIVTSKKKVKKAYDAYKKDPARKLKQNIITYPDGNSMQLVNPLPANYIKEREDKYLKFLKENSNDIDKTM